MTDEAIVPSVEQLRALAHPARVRMLALLRREGPATATGLATRLGLNSGATSYHLRQLAQHGFIVDDDERGNRRERWWRAAHRSTHAQSAALPEDGQDALDAYLQTVVTYYVQLLQSAVEERTVLPQAWRLASTFSDWHVRLTADQAADVVGRLSALVAEVGDSDEPGAEEFVVQLAAFPQPGTVAPVEDGR